MTPPPKDWNDKALDGLAERVGDVADEVAAMRELPAAVGRLAATVEGLSQSQRDLHAAHVRAGEDEVRRFVAVRDDLGKVSKAVSDLARTVNDRFDRVDLAHENAARGKRRGVWGIDWPTVLAVVSGITVPIVGVLIATGGGP
jgi:ABC-type transporter Mla subunit MlaD